MHRSTVSEHAKARAEWPWWLSVILAGGAAFSPGPLTSQSLAGVQLGGFDSHAAFENDCNVCHVPLQGLDPARCEACHTTEGNERASGEGLHGRLAATTACADCHPDHRGRGFDASAAALDRFDESRVIGRTLDLLGL